MAPVLGARRPARLTSHQWVLRVCPSQGSQGLGLSPGVGSHRGEGTGGAHRLPAGRAQGHHLCQQEGQTGRRQVQAG